MANSPLPEEKEILSYFQKLSNWGRWGDDDQLGTLNFLTPQKVQQSVSLVVDGTTVSVPVPLYLTLRQTPLLLRFITWLKVARAGGPNRKSLVGFLKPLQTILAWCFTDTQSLILTAWRIFSGKGRCITDVRHL